MDRLTKKKEADAQRKNYERRQEQDYHRNIPEERFLRLASYEDTGLMPEEIAALKSELEQVKEERDAAVKDLYKACISTPCNTGICAKKNCHGNIIPCEFEWRGMEGR